jgi:predicted secreted protein
MHPVSAAAVYLLFWTLSLFVVLPIGMRTDEEAGAERGHGHAESSPHDFRLGLAALRATILGSILFAAFYANWIYGWVSVDSLRWIEVPAQS